jgi:hypothetical protein
VINTESAEALWELLSSSTPPLRPWLDGLEPARWVEAEAAYLEFLAGGTLSRDYVLVAGVRR